MPVKIDQINVDTSPQPETRGTNAPAPTVSAETSGQREQETKKTLSKMLERILRVTAH
jgi:hypothetical protein